MKRDAEIRLFIEARRKGATQVVAAAKAGIAERTGRTYERAAILPSQRNAPRTYRTRKDPFLEDWTWVVEQLERENALQANTLFEELQRRRPGVYEEGQLRTLQRRVHHWRVTHGPERDVIFEQIHLPARMTQSDFTSMNELKITLSGEAFPHLLFHMILTHSRVEAVRICFSESFEAFAEGIEYGLAQFGGVPQEHRTDNLSAAVRTLDRADEKRFTERYLALIAHYGMRASTNIAGEAHHNGSVEQSHHRFKTLVDQELRLRGSRDFKDRSTYDAFLQALVRRRNSGKQKRFLQEAQLLRSLPVTQLDHARTIEVRVSRFSVVHILKNRYSVPSRLIGEMLTARIHAETIDLRHHGKTIAILPRLRGSGQHAIDYRHVAWSLARKPGAFAQYRFRDELFPTITFRRAYDALLLGQTSTADRHYVRILQRAASVSEPDVESALALLLERGTLPTFDEVKALTDGPTPSSAPMMSRPHVDLQSYDCLLGDFASV